MSIIKYLQIQIYELLFPVVHNLLLTLHKGGCQGIDIYHTVIYFIQRDDMGAIKIGRSIDPLKRLRELQTASPIKLTLLGMMDSEDSTETELHNRFKRLRIMGEWFDPGKALLRYIKRYSQKRKRESNIAKPDIRASWLTRKLIEEAKDRMRIYANA